MLTPTDKQEVKQLMADNNDVLMSRLTDFMLQNFLTKQEAQVQLASKSELQQIQQDVSVLKDDMGGLRTDLNSFMAFTENKFNVQAKLNLI